MSLTDNAQAILLLTVSLKRADEKEARPLSNIEWHRLATLLRDRNLEPGALLHNNLQDLLADWNDKKVTIPRLSALLERGIALSLSLEKWNRAGLWVIARSDPNYPGRLQDTLRSKRPPVLFGCGPKAPLDEGGIAIVGSRNADHESLQFARDLGDAAAYNGCTVITGASRGVDREAMFGALKRDGNVIGVLGNDLFRAASSAGYREFLMSENLTLVSPFNPESRFHVSRAMERNKYIYCLANRAVVVTSAFNKGGTWSGAMECLKAGWVPVWVRDNGNAGRENAAFVKRGARRLPEKTDSIPDLLREVLEDRPPQVPTHKEKDAMQSTLRLEPSDKPPSVIASSEKVINSIAHGDLSFFDIFVIRFRHLAKDGDMVKLADVVANLPDVQKAQLQKWLNHGVSEGIFEKADRPVRFRLKSPNLLPKL